ncbi:MAG: iron-containing alcohol dehydrogenase family protein, partial [Oscillospiraceae bacterium]|nr:iron-containing alcohol dehydrogenase family protein [Oscillospiraceae bacterium]
MRHHMLKIGAGKLHEVASTLREAEVGGKLLYISGPIVDEMYGPVVRPQLEEVAQIERLTVDRNTISCAMSVAERMIAADVDGIFGMGGGRVLDVCKYAAFITKKPFLSIPTALANDGIASPVAVLKREDNKPKSLGSAMPTMILLDTAVLATCPPQLIQAGMGDTISNYMALKDWDLAVRRGKDTMNGYAYLMSKNSLDALLKTQYDTICPEFIDVLANSIVLSGLAMDFAGSSRPVSGAEHLFSHALDYYGSKQSLHGLQVALGTVAVLRLIGEDDGEVLRYLRKFDVDINP